MSPSYVLARCLSDELARCLSVTLTTCLCQILCVYVCLCHFRVEHDDKHHHMTEVTFYLMRKK